MLISLITPWRGAAAAVISREREGMMGGGRRRPRWDGISRVIYDFDGMSWGKKWE